MRFIIMAAGEAERWGNYRGSPKHLAVVDGEPILHRTVRKFHPFGDVHIIARDDSYAVKGATLHKVTPDPAVGDIAHLLQTVEHWNPDGRTVLLYGDVYFTHDAVQKIVSETRREWLLFARQGKGLLKDYGECFAQSFWPEHHAESLAAIHEVRKRFQILAQIRVAGWEHYSIMCDDDLWPEGVPPLTRMVEINDLTDDFDYPQDIERFEAELKRCAE